MFPVACLALMLAVPPSGDTILISGKSPTQVKVADGTRPFLFGPFELTKQIRESSGVVFLHLEDVTFDAAIGSSATLYLVEAKGKEVRIDPSNYIGSVGHVLGGSNGPIQHTVEINDFKVAGKSFNARRNLAKMSRAYVAMVVAQGKVEFRQAVLTVETSTKTQR